jgi:hypothetical protein
MKKETIVKILYALAVVGFLTFLLTRRSAFMFCGGVLMIAASIILIVHNKNK